MEEQPKRKPPVRFTQELAEQICTRVAAGEALSTICDEEGMPARTTLYRWSDQRPGFHEAFARACAIAADTRADEALEVARRTTPATVQADRLRVSTLIWHASRGLQRRRCSPPEMQERKAERTVGPVRIREFVPVTREDGSVYTREIRPDGSVVDAEG